MAINLKTNIIKELGIDVLPEKEQEEILQGLGKIIFQSVLLRVMDELTEKEKDSFEKILTEKPNDEEAILTFLKAKVSNLDEIIKEVVSKIKKEAVDFAKK